MPRKHLPELLDTVEVTLHNISMLIHSLSYSHGFLRLLFATSTINNSTVSFSTTNINDKRRAIGYFHLPLSGVSK